MKIVFTDINTLGYEIDTSSLKKLGDLKVYDNIADEDIEQILLKNVPDVSVIITNASTLNYNNLNRLNKLKLICEAGTGYDNIDVNYCKEKGIAVTNVPGYSVNSVAQFTFAMFFYVQSHLKFYDEFTKTMQYSTGIPQDFRNHEFFELDGKTWGIIGLGEIGSKVASYAEGFGCKVIWYSITGKDKDSPYRRVTLEELMGTSDIVSIHAPISELTKDLVTMNELRQMKESGIILNLGRGGIINEIDLAKALDNGMIAAAGLDVTSQEPINNDNPLLSLKDPNKLLLTPHIAYGSIEARQKLMEGVYNSIKSFLEGGFHNRIV